MFCALIYLGLRTCAIYNNLPFMTTLQVVVSTEKIFGEVFVRRRTKVSWQSLCNLYRSRAQKTTHVQSCVSEDVPPRSSALVRSSHRSALSKRPRQAFRIESLPRVQRVKLEQSVADGINLLSQRCTCRASRSFCVHLSLCNLFPHLFGDCVTVLQTKRHFRTIWSTVLDVPIFQMLSMFDVVEK